MLPSSSVITWRMITSPRSNDYRAEARTGTTMNLSASPQLCTKALCIAGGPEIAAVISSFFNEIGEYFCVLEPPRKTRPDFLNEVLRRNNVAACLQADNIILAGLDQSSISAFQRYFSPRITTIVPSLADVDIALQEISCSDLIGEIACNPREVAKALLLAKRLRMKLKVDHSAPSLLNEFGRYLPSSNHIIVVEDSADFAPVIAANFAFSVDAELRLIPEVSRRDVEKVYDELYDRRASRGSTRSIRAEKNLKERSSRYQAMLLSPGTQFLTFVTSGVPYGYFIPHIASTHVFSRPDLGLNIFAGVYHASKTGATRVAVLLDPGHFKESESDTVVECLTHKRIFVKAVKGKDATVYNARNHIEHFPYDLLYICSHAGEINGRRLRVRFKDRHGEPHIFVIDHAAGIGYTGEGTGKDAKFEVMDFTRFVELDGVDWNDDEGKKKIPAGELAEEFSRIPVDDWDVIESKDIGPVRYCVALTLTDHCLLILFHSVAGYEHPIIFNNACVSFYQFAERLIYAGARAYIGTLHRVDTNQAKAVAEDFFRNLSTEKPLPVILWEAQRRVWSDPADRTYIHVGCHFTNIFEPEADVSEYLKNRLRLGLDRWTGRLNSASDSRRKEAAGRTVKFLAAQLRTGAF